LKNDRRRATEIAVPSGLPYYVSALALGIPAILLGLQITGWLFFIPAIFHGHADFRSFYNAGYMVRTGAARALYDYEVEKVYQNRLISQENLAMPFIHPAYEALLFVPLSLLPYRASYFAFLGVNLGLLVVCYWILRPHLQHLANIWSALPAAVFLFLPVTGTLMKGQDSILLLTLLVAATLCLGQRRELTAGALTALGLFRFQIVLPIAVLFLMWRRWRFCAGFAMAAAAVAAVSVSITGVAQTVTYAHSLISLSGSGSVGDLVRYAQPDWQMANLRGLVVGVAGSHLPAQWTRLVIFILSGGVFFLVGVLAPGRKGIDPLLIAITTSAAVSFHLLFHDLSILLTPLVLTLDRYVTAEATGNPAGRAAFRVATLMFVAPITISFVPDYFYLVAVPLCAFLLVLIYSSKPDSAGNELEGLRSI
jgi:hypothetical protein